MAENIEVLILVGSKNDIPSLEDCCKLLNEFKIPYRLVVASAHRTPHLVDTVIKDYSKKNLKVIIAAAGLANHLAGACAARTTVPVIGVPLGRGPLGGVDSLLSTVQMPPGIPVACVGVDGATNAAALAAQIIGLANETVRRRVSSYRRKLQSSVLKVSGQKRYFS